MRVLEGKELEDYLKQMQEWEAKKAKAIEDAFQREIVTGDDIENKQTGILKMKIKSK